jgi:hypothetical protein
MDKTDPPSISRREALALTAAAAAAAPAVALGAKKSPKREPVRFSDPIWNRETIAKIEADIAPGKFVSGYLEGVVHGVRDGEAVKPIMGFNVFSSTRVVKQPDGSYERMCRELIFYRDLQTGKLMDEWDNPYTGERVKVVDVANDPFNYRISEWFPQPPSYGGLNKAAPPKRPLILNWKLWHDDTVVLERDVHLWYKNALDPAKWVRESSGPMNRVSELFRYVIRREDMENPELTHLPHVGFWMRITPWLPWMLMGQSPGHIFYSGTFSSVKGVDDPQVARDVAERVNTRFPLYKVAPETWQEPSFSSLENYARYQTPAPPRADGK